VFYGKRKQVDAGVSLGSCAAGADQRREIAEDPGIGLSTLTRWLSQERDVTASRVRRRSICMPS
jgi:hypothetical protein